MRCGWLECCGLQVFSRLCCASVSVTLCLRSQPLPSATLIKQEIKLPDAKLTREFVVVEGYQSYWACSRGKTGYSGGCVLCVVCLCGCVAFFKPEACTQHLSAGTARTAHTQALLCTHLYHTACTGVTTWARNSFAATSAEADPFAVEGCDKEGRCGVMWCCVEGERDTHNMWVVDAVVLPACFLLQQSSPSLQPAIPPLAACRPCTYCQQGGCDRPRQLRVVQCVRPQCWRAT